MTLGDLTSRTAVLDAIREFDEIGQEAFLQKYGFGPSRDYVVIHDGKRYDSKALLGAAHAYQRPDLGPLPHSDFNGGKPTTDKLESLGFAIEELGDARPGDGRPPVADELPSLLESAMAELRSQSGTSERIRQLVTVDARGAVEAVLPEPFTVKGGAGIGTVAEVPWIGIYPTGSPATAQVGFYVVYLFAADGSRVYLSLNQGTEKVRGGIRPIEKRALDLRVAAGVTDADGQKIDLRSTTMRPRKYEAGNAYALRYDAGSVPLVETLRTDLARLLGLLRTADVSGLAFDPEIEPMHLIIKWSADIEAQTVALHEATAAARGSVWWGQFGQRANPISAARLDLLREQLRRGLPTYAFLYGGSGTVRAEILEITDDASSVDDERLPGYYERNKCNLFFRLHHFEPLEEGWLAQNVLLTTSLDPGKLQGALGNQTTPMYVYQRFSADQPPTPPQPELTMEWLAARTLWREAALEELLEAIDQRGQIILAGPPGTGKTWTAKHVARYLTGDQPLRLRIIQFHPSYGYEEFVEGLRPVIEDEVLTFKRVDGIVKQMAAEMEDSASTHVLIIDELNRANIPRVFGELMYLMEYRDETIDLQYSRDFQLPANLKIIATMNTADRSIRSIDVALRRRFEIFECPADPEILSAYYAADASTNVPDLVTGFAALNAALSDLIDRHHTIGQTFFMRRTFSETDLRRVWLRQIAPLIEDYLFDQPDVIETFTLERFWPDL
jgi:hypothetical protein